jgi:D-amino peptidase
LKEEENRMKVFISADIEGVTGVTHWDETDTGKPESMVPREQLTAEVVAACEGALQSGAKEVWVKDAHCTARNIIASKLPQEVKLIRGWSGHPFEMMQELDETFQAVLLVGYHSRAGQNTSPLAHMISSECLRLIRLNEVDVSEFLINAFTASSQRVPVAFVSGEGGYPFSSTTPYILWFLPRSPVTISW